MNAEFNWWLLIVGLNPQRWLQQALPESG